MFSTPFSKLYITEQLRTMLGATRSDISFLFRIPVTAITIRRDRRRKPKAEEQEKCRTWSDLVNASRAKVEQQQLLAPTDLSPDELLELRSLSLKTEYELLRQRRLLESYRRRYAQYREAHAIVTNIAVPEGMEDAGYVHRWLETRRITLEKKRRVCSLQAQVQLEARIAGLEAQLAVYHQHPGIKSRPTRSAS